MPKQFVTKTSTKKGIYKDALEEIVTLIQARVPIIWVITHEEARFIHDLAQKITLGSLKRDMWLWSEFQGLIQYQRLDANLGRVASGKEEGTQTPVACLNMIYNMPDPTKSKEYYGGCYILRDLHTELNGIVPRQLRDGVELLAKQSKTLIITSPVLAHGPGGRNAGLPPTLDKQVAVVYYELPKAGQITTEIETHISVIEASVHQSHLTGIKSKYEKDEVISFVRAVQGLTMSEITDAVNTSITHKDEIQIDHLLTAKKQIISRSDILEYIDNSVQLTDIGGMDLAKSYLQKYGGAHRDDAKAFGVEPLKAILLLGVPGCQPAGSKVLMSNGSWKNIENIQQGDKVLSPQKNGQVIPVIVEQTVIYQNRDCFKVQTTGFREQISYECSHNHILPLLQIPRAKVNGEMVYGKSELAELTVDQFNNSNIAFQAKARLFTSPAFDLPEVELPINPYAIGVMIGDGPVIYHPALTSADPEIFKALEDVGIEFGEVQFKPGNKAVTRYLIKDSAKLIKSVLGAVDSHEKVIPTQYKFSSLNQRLELLAGLIDTDGTWEEFSTTSNQLAEDFQWLVYSVGGVARIKERYTSYERGPEAKKFKSYRVYYSFVEYFPNQRLKRKTSGPRDTKWKNPRNRHLETIPTGKKTVYGFSLAGESQWYITDNWIVTHNTGKSLLAKSIGDLWLEPLLRLDIGKVMGSLVGQSENRMREAIHQAQACSPCLLWLDEIEKALSGTKSSNHSDGGTMARVFGTLLTAMEEGLEGVTIIATANDISALPPELIRRFNEVFFVDLPGPDERWDIFNIHLKKRGRDPNLLLPSKDKLLQASIDFTGAEIEKAIKDAIAGAFYAKQEDVTNENLMTALQDTKPISKVFGKKIQEMRDKARGTYRYASSWAQQNTTTTKQIITRKELNVEEALDGLGSSIQTPAERGAELKAAASRISNILADKKNQKE